MTVVKRTGIIGGSGLYAMQDIEILDELDLNTPWGSPSSPLLLARYHGQEIVFLPRHGSGHNIPPHKINYRANIYAMKLAGVSQIISISAVGSLRQEIAPGDFVLIDQFIDRTIDREKTFFDGPVVAHVSMAEPICSCLQQSLFKASKQAGITTHKDGTYLVMQGPQFSTRAESMLYRSWGMDVIGMTNMPEAKLAREAEMCYATIAMCTDYDCWHADEEDVSISSVLEVMHGNIQKAQNLLHVFFKQTPETHNCACQNTLDHGIFADLSQQNDEALRPIHALVKRLL
ncbi:MAG: S-methyl-5'-thioadenosine phosphorylase [Mariprofundaceae bacterium]|nr:S-methyl-5'-thioadenosine phosphorylase [Mariprofundaceae bacterium]